MMSLATATPLQTLRAHRPRLVLIMLAFSARLLLAGCAVTGMPPRPDYDQAERAQSRGRSPARRLAAQQGSSAPTRRRNNNNGHLVGVGVDEEEALGLRGGELPQSSRQGVRVEQVVLERQE